MLHPARRVNYPTLAKHVKVGHPHLLPPDFHLSSRAKSRDLAFSSAHADAHSATHQPGRVSKMERRADMYISTLQSMIRAMGGQLKIEAVFPEDKLEINQFRKLKKAAGAD
jgi:hypothetical protein